MTVTLASSVTPRSHQHEAVAAASTALADGGSALVVMATGTGKTLVSLWTAEALDARRIAVLVPSLALADQLLETWTHHTRWPGLAALAVCSESEHPERSLAPEVITAHLAGPGRRLVVATYHSTPTLVAAQEVGAAPFDLVVADEAHHQAGPPPGPFGTLVRGELATARTLHMTATPRTFTSVRGELSRSGLDDTEAFGARVYDLRLGRAIEAGLLSEYRIVLAGVDADELGRVSSRLGGDVDPWLCACAVAVVRSMASYGLRRCVTFHSRVGRARQMAALVAAVATC